MTQREFIQKLRKKIGNDLISLPAVVGIIYDENGRILLGKRIETDYWVLPGGIVEPKETPTDALLREVWEETGFLISAIRVKGIYGGEEHCITYKNNDRVSYVVMVFECRIESGFIRPDMKEFCEINFFSIPEIQQLELAKWIPQVLKQSQNNSNITYFQKPTWNPRKM